MATATLEEFLETLRREQEERKNIIKVLEDGEAFCDVSYGEVKVIVHVSVMSVGQPTFCEYYGHTQTSHTLDSGRSNFEKRFRRSKQQLRPL